MTDKEHHENHEDRADLPEVMTPQERSNILLWYVNLGLPFVYSKGEASEFGVASHDFCTGCRVSWSSWEWAASCEDESDGMPRRTPTVLHGLIDVYHPAAACGDLAFVHASE